MGLQNPRWCQDEAGVLAIKEETTELTSASGAVSVLRKTERRKGKREQEARKP